MASNIISTRDILQADATLIAGILILLTFTSVFVRDKSGKSPKEIALARSLYLLSTLGCIGLFCISASSAVWDFRQIALISFTIGLVFLVYTVGRIIKQVSRASDDGPVTASGIK